MIKQHVDGCSGPHPGPEDCAICLALKHGEICIDSKKKFPVCEDHADDYVDAEEDDGSDLPDKIYY